MPRFLPALAAFALVAPVGPPWAKFDDACAAASSTSKLVAVYTTIGSDPEGGDHGSPDADAALASKAVSARYGEFFWVRAADKATAKRVDAPSGGAHLIFVDPDGNPVGLWNVQVGGESAVLKALDEAKALYEPKPVPWFDGEPYEKSDKVKKKLILYAFLDDKENSEKAVKALEHPWVARDHGRLIFVRKYVLDTPLAKRFKITSVPTFIFFDPTQKEGKEVVERKSGDITTRMIRAPMKKFFERAKKAALESK